MPDEHANGTAESVEKRGRDSAGKFLPGHSLGGRRRGLDFRRVVEDEAEQAGITIEKAVWAIFRAMLRRATGAPDAQGKPTMPADVGAARLLLNLLCDDAPLEVRVTDTRPPLSEVERAVRIRAILAAAEKRMHEAEQNVNGEAEPHD